MNQPTTAANRMAVGLTAIESQGLIDSSCRRMSELENTQALLTLNRSYLLGQTLESS